MAKFRTFAKVFDDPVYCQILVQRAYDDQEEKPTVSFSVFPLDAGYGVCVVSLGFDTDEKADYMFDRVSPEQARSLVEPVMEAIAMTSPLSGGD